MVGGTERSPQWRGLVECLGTPVNRTGAQEAREQEQTEALDRHRYERQTTAQGERKGRGGPRADGRRGVPVAAAPRPGAAGTVALHAVGGARPSQRCPPAADRGDVGGGRAQRDMESALEQARGQCVVAQRAVRDRTTRLRHAYDALRTRALQGADLASLVREIV